MLTPIGSMIFLTLIVVSLLACSLGVNSYILLYLKGRARRIRKEVDVKEWPLVTIQIPTYNEKSVIERTLETCLKLDYPKERLEIVVVDDSTDETTQILDRYEALHFPTVKVTHRSEREGYKGGALNTAIKHSSGELFLILDADTLPDRRFLKEAIPYMLEDNEVGFVQGKIEYINAEHSWLTRSLALANDWYRTFSQSALSKGGMFLSFLGHGGVFRRTAIEEVGGWESDTITEDMDLSYRVQIAGWKGLFAEEAKCLEEVPASYPAAVLQHNRHLKGPIQNLRKHGRRILGDGRMGALKKLEALIQMAYPLSYPLWFACVVLSALTYLTIPASFLIDFWLSPAGLILSLFTLVTCPYISLVISFLVPSLIVAVLSPFIYLASHKRRDARISSSIGSVLGILLIWNDNLLTGTKTLIELIAGKRAVWVRTPRMEDEKLASNSRRRRKRMGGDMSEGLLRILSGAVILICFILVIQKNFVINAFGLVLPVLGWIASAYLLLR